MAEIDFASLDRKQSEGLLTNCVVPRPIALVSTRSSTGRCNAAPFSFFNVVSGHPGIVAVGMGDRSDGSPKDTLVNIRTEKHFAVNLVSADMVQMMNVCGIDFVNGENEIELAGLTTVADFVGAVPRLAETPVAIGCTLLDELRYGSYSIVLGTVERMWINDSFILPDLKVDGHGLNLVARLGGPHYGHDWQRLKMPRISLESWQSGSLGPQDVDRSGRSSIGEKIPATRYDDS